MMTNFEKFKSELTVESAERLLYLRTLIFDDCDDCDFRDFCCKNYKKAMKCEDIIRHWLESEVEMV